VAVQSTFSVNHAVAYSGQLADNGPHDIATMRNDESTAEMAFGRAVRFASVSDAQSAKLPAAETDKVAGILVLSHAYDAELELGTTGVVPGAELNVLRKGRIWVTVEDAVEVGSRLWVRAVAGGDPEFLGGLCIADDGSDTIDCTNQGVFRSAASAGGLAVLEVDFTNKPGI
jgi:hypothetical protein